MDFNVPPVSTPDPADQKKERRPVAAQACDNCRGRKQRCDEQRPKCGLCRRLRVDCVYRETQPTKKDQTLVEILNRLKSIEGKLDRVPQPGAPQHEVPQPEAQPSTFEHGESNESETLQNESRSRSPGTVGGEQHWHSAAHKILNWPAMEHLVGQALPPNSLDLDMLKRKGPPFILDVQQGGRELPRDEELEETPFIGMQSQARRGVGAPRVVFPELSSEIMIKLATAYFDTFNLIYPFMDRQTFMSDTLPRVQSEGFDDDGDSIITLLIFALGELAVEGVYGNPTETYDDRPSGVRGGTLSRPPGLAFFNAARKHIGFILTGCDLDHVQIFSLVALYFGTCSHHLEFWRMTEFACSACKVLITGRPIDWNSPVGDLVKRVYWHCAIMETGFRLDLDLPDVGLISFEEEVGIPMFISPFCEADQRGNQFSHFEAHYASQIALRRLCAYIHYSINQLFEAVSKRLGPHKAFDATTTKSLKLLASQVTEWRDMLPPQLKWDEEDPASFPVIDFQDQLHDQYVSSHTGHPHTSLFTPDMNSEPVHFPYAYDVQVAILRTRYYYVKYMVYRPFVYKALHFPEQMTLEDAEGAAECLRSIDYERQSCLNWPIVLSPTAHRKRLVPYLFCWSQNILGVLLILHLTRHNPMLGEIRSNLCGVRFEKSIDQSVELMIDWIRDLKRLDGIALWCWKIVRAVYGIEGDKGDED